MPTIKQLTRLEVATTDLADATATYRKNFGFEVSRSADGDSATVNVGGAEIHLRAGASVSRQIETNGEGMMGLWLEADDVDAVASALAKVGVETGAIRIEQGRRVLAVDPKFADQVPLFVFDRKR